MTEQTEPQDLVEGAWAGLAAWINGERIQYEWWQLNTTTVGMGAVDCFDYAGEGGDIDSRLTRCYELAARVFWGADESEYADRPAPLGVVHGSWHGPDAPNRINHAWVILDNGQVWEPITATICEPEKFQQYTRAEIHHIYDYVETRRNIIRTEHWGTW